MLAAMFPNMTEAQMVQKIVADQQQQSMMMAQMEQAIAAAQAAGAAAAAAGAMGGGASGKGGDWHQGLGAWEQGGKGRNGGVVLDKKQFRRVDKFEGNPAKFKSWIFDLITAVGSVDLSLAKDLKEQLKARPKIEIVDNVFQLPEDLALNLAKIMQYIKVNYMHGLSA